MSSSMYVLSKCRVGRVTYNLFFDDWCTKSLSTPRIKSLNVYILKKDAVRSYSSDFLCLPVCFEISLFAGLEFANRNCMLNSSMYS